MPGEIIYCADIPGEECCDSCHSQEYYENGYLDLAWWLQLCCIKESILQAAGVSTMDQAAVRAWIAAQAPVDVPFGFHEINAAPWEQEWIKNP